MAKAKIVWFDKQKGIGEALDENGRVLFLNALEVVPSASPLKLAKNEQIECVVRKTKNGYAAKKITKVSSSPTRKRSADITL
jgi:hypothetical protein